MRPEKGEYAEYYQKYVELTPDDVVGALELQIVETARMLASADGNYRYEPGKWTIAEVVGHMIDTERIFAYRMLRIARGDEKPMEGFDQDDYVRNAPACGLAELVEEFKAVRRSTVLLLRHLDEKAWLRRGTANQNPVTVRALAFIIAGHELHHRGVLASKYAL